MSSLRKLLLLTVTIMPILYGGLFFIFVLMVVVAPEQVEAHQEWFIYLMIAHFGVMLLLMALFGYYCMLLYRDSSLDIAKKLIWLAAFLFTGPFGMVVFWYAVVWNRPKESAATSGV